MDWTKAKTILIIALLATDLFLIATYGFREPSDELRSEEALLSVLRDNQISVQMEEIPQERRSMAALKVKYRNVPPEEVEALLESTDIEATDESDEAYTEAAEEFLSYLGMMSKYAEVQSVERVSARGVEVRFGCVANGVPLDGSRMNCRFENGRLSGFDSLWLEPDGYADQKKETISAWVALITLMSEKESEEAMTITDMALVYHIDYESYEANNAVSDTAFPAWRVTLADGRTVYAEAFER